MRLLALPSTVGIGFSFARRENAIRRPWKNEWAAATFPGTR
jgi:hypothetical protein